MDDYIGLRPDEDKIDDYFHKISVIWDAIILTFKEFKTGDCAEHRNFNSIEKANFIYTPIGLKLLGELIRVRTKKY